MKKCVLLKHFLILIFILISNNVSATEINSNDNITLVPSLELPRKVTKRLIFLKNNISDMTQVPQFAHLCDAVEQGQTVIDKDIVQAGLQQLNQYSFGLDTSQNSSEADLVKQYTQKIKSDLNELEVILVERALPSCCQNISCCTAIAPSTKINTCTKPTCFGKAEEVGSGTGNFDGKVRINSLAESSDCGSGALVVKGGAGFGGDLNVCGKERISNRSQSIDCAHGALVVEGGVGIGLNLNVCGEVSVASTTESTDCTTGASVIAGGQAIGGNLNVCGKLHVFNDGNSTTCTDGAVVIDGALGIGQNANICGLTHLQNTTDSTKCTEGALVVDGGAGFGKNVNICGKVHIFDTTNSGACNSGALVVDGGVGIAKDTNICGALNVEGVISTNSYFSINGSSVVASNIANCNLSVGDNTNPIANGYSNTAVGESAMQNNQVGVRDTALGCQPLQNNIRGNDDTAIGAQALLNLSGSDRNTACGSQTSFGSLDVNDTVAVGYAALHDNQTSQNTAVGSYAMTNNVFGGQDTAVGFEALRNNIGADLPPPIDFFLAPGSSNTAVGHHSQRENLYGFANTSVGSSSLQNNFIGFQNVAVGDNTLYFNQAYYNTAVGSNSMYTNAVGIYNTAVGESSLYFNIAGIYNTSIGAESMVYNTVGSWNSVCGFDALTSGIAGFYNCVLGANSLDSVLLPLRNTIVGYHSITGNDFLPQVSIVDNATLGYQTLEKTRTDGQTAIGTQSLKNNIYGERNTACGYQALYSNIGIPVAGYGFDNTAVGHISMYDSDPGFQNTAVGSRTQITSAQIPADPTHDCVAIGFHSRINKGQANTLVGAESYSRGSYNTIIGGYAQNWLAPVLPPPYSLDEGVIVGYGAYAYPANGYSFTKGNVVLGYKAYGIDIDSIAIGYNARSAGYGSIGMGQYVIVRADKAIAIAPQGLLTPQEVLLPLDQGQHNIMIGHSTTCLGKANVLVGGVAKVKGSYNTIVGYYNNNAPAGGGTVQVLTGSTQIGAYATAKADNTVAVGYYSRANFSGATAIGKSARVNGNNAVALGIDAQVLPGAISAIAIGDGAKAGAAQSIAIGSGVTAAGIDDIIIGSPGLATTIAIGGNKNAGSVTIGSLSNVGMYAPPIKVGVAGPGPTAFVCITPGSGYLYFKTCFCYGASIPFSAEADIFEEEPDRNLDDNLMALDVVHYNKKNQENDEATTRSQRLNDQDIGFVIEQVQEVMPEILVDEGDGTPPYVNLNKLIFYMVKQLQAHHAKLHDQQLQLTAQQAEIDSITQQYEQTKSILEKLMELEQKHK